MIPDAPGIRDAELNGIPADDPVICPCCGGEADRFYFYNGGTDVLGCDRCIEWKDAWEVEHEKNEEEDWRDCDD